MTLSSARLIKAKHFEDGRGFFTEVWAISDQRLPRMVQFNLSRSDTDVVRGLHFNTTMPQAKLIRVPQGSIIDVVIDLRLRSNDYGKVQCFEVNDPQQALYVPKGYAHGFMSLMDDTLVLYGCDEEYLPERDNGISPFDSQFQFPWLNLNGIKVTEKDTNWPLFNQKDGFDINNKWIRS